MGFHAAVLAMLGAELFFHREPETIAASEAAAWTTGWIVLALLWGAGTWYLAGPRSGLEFLTGYVIELSLSIDNVFVFIVIFSYFQVPREFRYRVLMWGVTGALLMRGAMIGAGTFLIHRFEWILYVFGGFLVLTGVRMARTEDHEVDPGKNPFLRLLRKWIPITKRYYGQKFFIERMGRRAATPLFVTLIVIESTDIVFAVDSIPAIFGVTREPFIVYTSNILAVACLRSLYFVLEGAVQRFRYLDVGIAAVLVFIGVKLLLHDVLHIPILVSLLVVISILGGSVAASAWIDEEDGREAEEGGEG